MIDQPVPTAAVNEPGELIAVLPYLLGYHPTSALVMITVAGQGDIYANSTLCADLPLIDSDEQVAQRHARLARESGSAGVILIVVGTTGQARLDPLPYHELIEVMRTHMERRGISLLHAMWTPSTTAYSHWWCYARSDECHGVVPPPEQAPAAVAAIAAGIEPFPSRQELIELLRPDDEAVLARRADHIHQLLTATGTEATAHAALQQIHAAISRDHTSQLPETDIVQLAAALTNPLVQAVCLGLAATEEATAAEQLWLALTKSFPTPYRAEPACLLTATAYLHGNRAVASQALRIAEQANPDHQVIYLLQVVLAFGIPPVLVAESLTELATQAREVIETGRIS